ncbi:MAG: RecQ family ATP-dependent DNA helicase [Chloroflexi bacterium]|nr:RecQ family ATP-dependent DNA helicase [Chloroflexota bacterium]MYF22404.1 RecQ family ATP-dependent DNA helicase [Chloroflexota bacterium]
MVVTDQLHDALRNFYGYDSFRPQQRETIEHVRAGGDALVLMPTGGGKSLCYQLPAMLSDGLTVVVSPLIALMHDQVTALQRAGANAQYLNSTLSPMESAQVERQVADGSVRLLYVAPERVNTDRFRALLEQRYPSLIAIDEAHCISEWGHEFRPDYRVLRRLTERFVDVPTVACTATATPQVQRDIVDQLDRPRMRTFLTSFMRDNLTLRIVEKRNATKRVAARLRQLGEGSAIVYSQSRNNTEKTAEQLRRAGIRAEFYHAGMNGNERHAVQDRFLSGETPVICATIAFGMGIDKPDIRLVAHLDMPASIESYYQETGRAGRDGEPSECLLFYTKGIWHTQQFFIRQIQDEEERRQRVNRLRTMMSFCEQQACRWSTILKYFGEQPSAESCGHCDHCLGEEAAPADAASPRLVDPADPPGQDAQPPLSPEEDRLYEALRQERSRLASAEATSAYIVASNRELSDIARRKPRTIAELIEIKGIRHRKAARFGQQLLEVVAQHAPEAAAAAPEESTGAIQMTLDSSPEDWQQRFNALAEWRTATGADEPCDPSDLLSFAAMRELAQSPPATREALAAIDGVGAAATERHADRLLDLLGGRAATPAPAPLAALKDDSDTPSWQISADLYQDGHTILAIAERRMLSPGTVASHLTTALRNGLDIDLKSALPSTEQIQAVRRELGRDPDASTADIHDRLDHRISRPELQLTIAYLRPPETTGS